MRLAPAGLISLVVAAPLCACMSQRYTSTLKPSNNPQLTLGSTRFRIETLDVGSPEVRGSMPEITQERISQAAMQLYPQLFAEEWTALPLHVHVEAKREAGNLVGLLLMALSCGIIPLPAQVGASDYSVTTSLRDADGDALDGKRIDFRRETVAWVTIFGPLGSLPVLGESDIPRDSVFLMMPISGHPYQTVDVPTAKGLQKMQASSVNYTTACLVEAIVQSLLKADQVKLADTTRRRAARLQEVSVDGNPFWCCVEPTSMVGQRKDDPPEQFSAMFFRGRPKHDGVPLEMVIVARRTDGGGWQPVDGYLHMARTLTCVSVSLDQGTPSQVVLRTVDDPPLEEFVDVEAKAGREGANTIRWSNAVLLQAKNSSLARLLREEGRSAKLTDLVTRIEKAVLDMNEQSERANDRAQRMLEKGEGDPEPDRELAILCRQRIEVLKAILSAIKREVEDRGK